LVEFQKKKQSVCVVIYFRVISIRPLFVCTRKKPRELRAKGARVAGRRRPPSAACYLPPIPIPGRSGLRERTALRLQER